ncbi:unnamed protein product [Boreogadus saida]
MKYDSSVEGWSAGGSEGSSLIGQGVERVLIDQSEKHRQSGLTLTSLQYMDLRLCSDSPRVRLIRSLI